MGDDPVAWKYRFRLSKGSILLLHLAAAGRVCREQGRWIARTHHSRRDVTMRIDKMVNQGVLSCNYLEDKPVLTDLGRQYLDDHPLEDVLNIKVIR